MRKRFLCLLIVLAILCSSTGCSLISRIDLGQYDNTPEAAVKKFCNAMVNYNGLKMNECLNDPVASDSIALDDLNLSAFYKKEAAKIQYEIISSTLSDDGETATIDVTFTFVDASDVYSDTLKAFAGKKLTSLLAGASTEGDIFITMFNEKAAAATLTTTTEDATFTVLKVGDEWKLKSVPTQVPNVLACNAGGKLMPLFGF